MRRRTTTAQGGKTAETECGRPGQDQDQLSSNRDWGERRKGDGQEESDNASEVWSGVSTEDLVGSIDTGGQDDRWVAGG